MSKVCILEISEYNILESSTVRKYQQFCEDIFPSGKGFVQEKVINLKNAFELLSSDGQYTLMQLHRQIQFLKGVIHFNDLAEEKRQKRRDASFIQRKVHFLQSNYENKSYYQGEKIIPIKAKPKNKINPRFKDQDFIIPRKDRFDKSRLQEAFFRKEGSYEAERESGRYKTRELNQSLRDKHEQPFEKKRPCELQLTQVTNDESPELEEESNDTNQLDGTDIDDFLLTAEQREQEHQLTDIDDEQTEVVRSDEVEHTAGNDDDNNKTKPLTNDALKHDQLKYPNNEKTKYRKSDTHNEEQIVSNNEEAKYTKNKKSGYPENNELKYLVRTIHNDKMRNPDGDQLNHPNHDKQVYPQTDQIQDPKTQDQIYQKSDEINDSKSEELQFCIKKRKLIKEKPSIMPQKIIAESTREPVNFQIPVLSEISHLLSKQQTTQILSNLCEIEAMISPLSSDDEDM